MTERASGPAAEPGPVVGIFGATEQARRHPARRQTVLALFGAVALDLREAQLPPDFQLRVYALFGGVKIELPETARVETTGFSLVGARSVTTGGTPSSRGGPLVRLRAVALFGGVAVKVTSHPRPWLASLVEPLPHVGQAGRPSDSAQPTTSSASKPRKEP